MDHTYCPYCMTPVKPGEPCPGCGLTEGSYHPQPHHLPPGTMLADRYLLGRVLGEGGFGITYIGCDTRLELRVAVKEYFPGNHVARNCATSLAVTCYDGVAGRGFEQGRERFIREARTMAKMDKTPQIVAVRDFFQENNTAYIVMEYVEGTTFKELVAQKGGGMRTGELLPMVEPLFGALEAMHCQGLIHRDISPDNLMLENGMVRLLDFGCARESAKGNETMTIVLKQGYSPVEQYQHKGQGPWTDVYSLAATMYYCLTGKTPPQALDRICDDELIPPRKLGADLTREQEWALLYGMGLQPTRRFRSVREFYAALYQGAPVPVAPIPPEQVSPPDTRERENEPESGKDTPPESAAQMPAEEQPARTMNPEPEAGQPAEPEEQSERTMTPEPEAELPPEPAEESQPGETDEPGSETAVKPDRRKLAIIGGAVAAVALIIALIFTISKLISPDDPTAEESDHPAESLEPLPGDLFDGAAQVNSEQEFLELLADGSVSAIIIPEGREVGIGNNQAVELTKPLRLEPHAAFWTDGVMTVSSTVDLMEGARLDQDADFTLTESGALYIGPGAYVHVTNPGKGSDDIAGTVQVAEGGDFGVGGETVSLSGAVLAEGGCGINGKTAVSGTIQVTGSGGVWFDGEADVTGTVQVAEGGGTWFNGETDITGTVQVAEGGFAGFNGFTTVSGPGRLEMNGNGHSGHVFKTVDGGGVTVGDTGWINFNVLWLEKSADLNAASDHIGMDQSRYIVADEDGPFANAAHVNSFRELEQAANDRLVSAIVIDSGFEMEYGLTINKPVRISEGVELSTNDHGGQPFFADVTVNYGSVTGFMQLVGQCVYLNYGGTDVSVYANGGNNYLLNMGDLNLQNGQYINATIVNLGRMRHENYGGEDTNFLDLIGVCVQNLGEITVRSGNRMWLGDGGYFENNGELILEENARLENSTHIGGGGQIRIRGTLDNDNGILDIGDPSQLSMEGGRVENGIIQTGGIVGLLERDENVNSQVLTLLNEPDAMQVSVRETLDQLLDSVTMAIRVTGNIDAGDLSPVLHRDLIVEEGTELVLGELTMDGGVLIVRGGSLRVETLDIRGGGQLQLDGGRIDTGALTLEDSTGVIWGNLAAGAVRLNNAKLINWGNMFQCGELTADGGSDFYDRGNLELAEGGNIAVNSGAFVGVSWLELPNGSITVGEGGRMILNSGAHLYDGVTVTNRGSFDVLNCDFWLDGGASIVNNSHFSFRNWDWQEIHLGGEITNRGYMFLNGAERVDGVLTNYGELEINHNGSVIQIGGQLNNNGTAFAYNHNAGFQGSWNGRNLEYR